MGINGSANLLWSVSDISLKSFVDFDVGKRVAVDGNAIAWQKFGKGKHISTKIINEVATELKMIAHSAGIIVTVVVDGDMRPDCKRASLHRQKWRQLYGISLKALRMKVVQLSLVIKTKKENLQDYSKEEEELKTYEMAAKTLDSSSAGNFFDIPSNFGQRL